jgi:hypothetical protein
VRPGWIIGVLFLLVLMQLYCGVCELDFLHGFQSGFGERTTSEGGQVDTAGTILYLIHPQVASYDNMLEGLFAWISVPVIWVWSLLNCFFFNYSFLQGSWWLFRVFLLCISIGVIVMLVLSFRKGAAIAG